MTAFGELHMLSASTLLSGLAAGELTAEELMEATLARIETVNPRVNAVVSLRPASDLLAEARSRDSEGGGGPLHGLPIAIKDLAQTKGLRTTWGSPLMANFIPDQDDLFVARLKAAGAIVIGKTNTPEFGLGSNSYNPVHGRTANAWNPDFSAGGSSGGAAVALATGMLALADGSDMMGSLRNPAAWNNVYGFRPSYGLVPDNPAGDMFLHQLSTNGPMARSIRDLALLLDVMAGPDTRLPHSLPTQSAFSDRLPADLRGRRIGWIGDWGGHYPMEDGVLSLCSEALVKFSELGVEVEAVQPDFDPFALWQSWTTLRSWAVAAKLGAVYENPESRKHLKPEAIWEIERGLALSGQEIQKASEVRSDWYRTLAYLFQQYEALALPAAQCFPFPAEWDWPREVAGHPMESYHHWMEVVVPASLAGIPALSLPAGFGAQGLPMGFQLLGPKGADAALLQLGQGYARAHGAVDIAL
ncbi:MAG: amidase [Pseudomonadota bacterium]